MLLPKIFFSSLIALVLLLGTLTDVVDALDAGVDCPNGCTVSQGEEPARCGSQEECSSGSTDSGGFDWNFARVYIGDFHANTPGHILMFIGVAIGALLIICCAKRSSVQDESYTR